MKKILSIITATVLLFGSAVVPVSAEGTEPENEINYTVIEGGKCEAKVLKGSVTETDGAVVMSAASLELNTPIVLPLGYEAEWSISFSGTMLPNGTGSGTFLADTLDTLNRVYLGVNTANRMYVGININGNHANYCWSVSLETMSEEHNYQISFSNGEFLLSIDGGEAFGMSSMNIDQKYAVDITSSKQASYEIVEKIKAIRGQEYVTMTHIGSTHTILRCNAQFKTFSAKTSSIEGYQALTTHPLSDLTIDYLGSSITYGSANGGTSFVEITNAITGNSYNKEAVSGTCLAVTGTGNSYVERFANLPAQSAPDYLMIQLSSNDFTQGIASGEISTSKELADLNSATITGAIETLIAMAKQQWSDTTVVFYTCPIGESWEKYNEYKEYVNTTMKKLEVKWAGDMVVLDLFNSDYLRSSIYLNTDQLHPLKQGYNHLIVPEWINFLYELENPDITQDKNGARIMFRGGSLRMDYTEFDKTSIRFGYKIQLPEGATLKNWSWQYTTTDWNNQMTANGKNKVIESDGSTSANLVITGVPESYYNLSFTSKMKVEYILNGTVYTIEEKLYRSRSVSQVAEMILASATANETEKTYAANLMK